MTLTMHQKCIESPEIRLMRQDNLSFYAEIASRAFTGTNRTDVPIEKFLIVVDNVQQEMRRAGREIPRDASYHLDVMLGKLSSYDRQKHEPWLGSERRQHEDVIVLLEPARRVMQFMSEGTGQESFLAISSLGTFASRVTTAVARLNGDTQSQIDALERKRLEIEAEIRNLKDHGAAPISDRDRKTLVYEVFEDLSRIKAGFDQVPTAKRNIHRANGETFLDASSQGEALDAFMAREGEWHQSPERAVLDFLFSLYADQEKTALLQNSIEQVSLHGKDFLEPTAVRDAVTFLPDMLTISDRIHAEIAQIWRAAAAYLRNPNYAAHKEEAIALREARSAIARVRDTLEPSPRDTRLKDIGLSITLPLATSPLTHVRLTMEPPTRTKPDAPADLVADAADIQAAVAKNAAETLRSKYLSNKAIRERVMAAMDGREQVSLSDVLRRFPVRYGRQEISRYLAFAGGEMPSILIEGLSFSCRIEENGRTSIANVPNPLFRREGAIGEGFGDFSTIGSLLTAKDLRSLQIGHAPVDFDRRAS